MVTKEKASKFPTVEKFNDGKLYQKIGKRYHAVSDIHAYEGLSKGSWLVTVDAGCTSVRQSLTPDTAAIEIAFRLSEDKLARIISKHCEARPKQRLLTKREQKAIAAYYKVMGKDKVLYFEYPAIQTMAQEILKDVRG